MSEEIAAGLLMEMLPDYPSPDLELYPMFLPGQPLLPRVRLFVDDVPRLLVPGAAGA